MPGRETPPGVRRSDAGPGGWIAALQPDARERERAVGALHALLLRAARTEAARRGPRLGIAGRELDDLTYEAAGDAVVAVLAKLEDFRGESRFETWAYRFALLEVTRKTGRHAWRRSVPRDDSDEWRDLPDRFSPSPSEAAERRELFREVRRLLREHLTVRQRTVFEAVVLQEIPPDVLAAQLQTSRGAIYKTLFDARRKLRGRLVADGYLDGRGSPAP